MLATFALNTSALLADNALNIVKERKIFTVAGSLETPCMSIYFPLPSFAASAFFNIGDFNIGVKGGTPAPWILGHIANADAYRTQYVPVYFEPIEIRYIFFSRVLLGVSLGYRYLAGSKGERSPVLEKPQYNSETDGTYEFKITEWSGKAYLGIGLNGDPAQTGVPILEVGGIWAIDRKEEYSYSIDREGKRGDDLRATNFDAYLASNLSAFRESVHKQVFPFQYVYVAFRINFWGI